MADNNIDKGVASTPQNNRMALASAICGISAWVLFCFNSTLGVLISVVTLGIGAICLAPLGCLVPILLIAAVITGHMGLKQIDSGGGSEGGRGLAKTGLISGYIGLGLTLIFIIIGFVMAMVGASIPFLGGAI